MAPKSMHTTSTGLPICTSSCHTSSVTAMQKMLEAVLLCRTERNCEKHSTTSFFSPQDLLCIQEVSAFLVGPQGDQIFKYLNDKIKTAKHKILTSNFPVERRERRTLDLLRKLFRFLKKAFFINQKGQELDVVKRIHAQYTRLHGTKRITSSHRVRSGMCMLAAAKSTIPTTSSPKTTTTTTSTRKQPKLHSERLSLHHDHCYCNSSHGDGSGSGDSGTQAQMAVSEPLPSKANNSNSLFVSCAGPTANTMLSNPAHTVRDLEVPDQEDQEMCAVQDPSWKLKFALDPGRQLKDLLDEFLDGSSVHDRHLGHVKMEVIQEVVEGWNVPAELDSELKALELEPKPEPAVVEAEVDMELEQQQFLERIFQDCPASTSAGTRTTTTTRTIPDSAPGMKDFFGARSIYTTAADSKAETRLTSSCVGRQQLWQQQSSSTMISSASTSSIQGPSPIIIPAYLTTSVWALSTVMATGFGDDAGRDSSAKAAGGSASSSTASALSTTGTTTTTATTSTSTGMTSDSDQRDGDGGVDRNNNSCSCSSDGDSDDSGLDRDRSWLLQEIARLVIERYPRIAEMIERTARNHRLCRPLKRPNCWMCKEQDLSEGDRSSTSGSLSWYCSPSAQSETLSLNHKNSELSAAAAAAASDVSASAAASADSADSASVAAASACSVHVDIDDIVPSITTLSTAISLSSLNDEDDDDERDDVEEEEGDYDDEEEEDYDYDDDDEEEEEEGEENISLSAAAPGDRVLSAFKILTPAPQLPTAQPSGTDDDDDVELRPPSQEDQEKEVGASSSPVALKLREAYSQEMILGDESMTELKEWFSLPKVLSPIQSEKDDDSSSRPTTSLASWSQTQESRKRRRGSSGEIGAAAYPVSPTKRTSQNTTSGLEKKEEEMMAVTPRSSLRPPTRPTSLSITPTIPQILSFTPPASLSTLSFTPPATPTTPSTPTSIPETYSIPSTPSTPASPSPPPSPATPFHLSTPSPPCSPQMKSPSPSPEKNRDVSADLHHHHQGALEVRYRQQEVLRPLPSPSPPPSSSPSPSLHPFSPTTTTINPSLSHARHRLDSKDSALGSSEDEEEKEEPMVVVMNLSFQDELRVQTEDDKGAKSDSNVDKERARGQNDFSARGSEGGNTGERDSDFWSDDEDSYTLMDVSPNIDWIEEEEKEEILFHFSEEESSSSSSSSSPSSFSFSSPIPVEKQRALPVWNQVVRGDVLDAMLDKLFLPYENDKVSEVCERTDFLGYTDSLRGSSSGSVVTDEELEADLLDFISLPVKRVG